MENYLNNLDDPRRDALLSFHNENIADINKAKGSAHNHQAWEGGYREHIRQCFDIAAMLYTNLEELYGALPFTFDSAIIVLYFHDVEKIFKYSANKAAVVLDNEWKLSFYNKFLPQEYNFHFTNEELNALKYIHGEGDDYSKLERKMGRLGAFCHACDILSARLYFDKGKK